MFGISTPELVIIVVLALLLFGPKKMPEIARSIGEGIRELRRASRDVVEAIENFSDDEPDREKENINNVSDSIDRHQ